MNAQYAVERPEINHDSIIIDIRDGEVYLNDSGILVPLVDIRRNGQVWIYGDYDGMLSCDRTAAYVSEIHREIRAALTIIFKRNPTALKMATCAVKDFMASSHNPDIK